MSRRRPHFGRVFSVRTAPSASQASLGPPAVDRWRPLFDLSTNPMWVFETGTFRFLEVNQAALEKYGYTREEFLAMTILDIREEAEQKRLRECRAPVSTGRRDGWGVWQHRTKSGEELTVEVSSVPFDFEGRKAVLVSIADVTPQLRAGREMAYRALHDSLTGLPNRSLLMDRMTHALVRNQRGSALVGAISIDLDRFKVVNDAKGHAVGDLLLAEVGKRLANATRGSDTLARVGGDEFVIVLEGIKSRAEAATAGGRIGWALDAPFTVRGEEYFLSASQGIALADPKDTAEALLSRAEAAMLLAKQRGRARYEFATDVLTTKAMERLELESDLRRAIDRDQLELFYQPVVFLPTGEIVGAEALLRWHHPRLGIVPPNRFIPSAEESGLIVPIGEWVIQRALEDAKLWSGPAANLSIAVNLSASQLTVSNLAFTVARALSSSGIDPARLHLEITESVFMRDTEHSMKTIAALRDLGIRIAIDDFGTGYSTLSYVQRLPVDILKIDKSFVDRLNGLVSDSSIVGSIVQLARSLNLSVVAEGVEFEHQKNALLALGCDRAQGYYYARPAPQAELLSLLHGGPLPPLGSGSTAR